MIFIVANKIDFIMGIMPIFFKQKESYLDVWVQLNMETKMLALNCKISIENGFLVSSHSAHLMFNRLYFECQLLLFIVNILWNKC